MMRISVVIHTYNAEKHLQDVLNSVKDFDEIVICDMYSNDTTIAIAQKNGCRVIYHENTGFAEAARTFGIQSATYDWVLMIDADEIVPVKLKEFLYNIIQEKDCPAGIRIPIKNYFMGKFMRCTYPNYILRFFKKEGTVWPPYVHTQPSVEGKIYTIPKNRKDLAFIHLSNDSVSTITYKTNLYSENEIKKRKNKKYGYFSIVNQPLFCFFKFYILKGGILDGKAGLIYSGLKSIYKYTSIAKIIEQSYKSADMENDYKTALKK